MIDKHRDILRHCWHWLRQDLELEKLLPHLVDVLDPEDEQEVKAEATREDRIDKLLDIIPRRGPAAFKNFLNALQKTQPFLASILSQDSELNRSRSRGVMLRAKVEEEQQDHQETRKELEELKSVHETLMAENEVDKQVMNTRVQELENVIEHLEEELSIERRKKEVLNIDFAVLKESFAKISEELIELVEKLSHYDIKDNGGNRERQLFHETDAKNVKHINRSFYGAKGIPLPKRWTPMPNSEMTIHRIELLQGSSKYQDAMRKKQATAGGMHVQKIKRTYFPHLDQSYMTRKQKMDQYNGGNIHLVPFRALSRTKNKDNK